MPRKTVLVTGASRGIGKAVAVKFARRAIMWLSAVSTGEEQLMQTERNRILPGPLPGIQRRYGGHGLL